MSHYPKDVPFEVPKGWVWTEIAEIASSINYGVSESAKASGKYRLLRITDIQNGKVSWESVPFTDYPEEKAKSFELSNGDILFARTGATVGKSYLVESVPSNAIYASYLIRIQYSNSISSRYLKYFFESGYYWEQISSSSVGVGQPNVNGSSLGKLKIPLPPVAEQKRITIEAQRWISIIDELEYESKHLGDDIDAAKLKILDLAIHGKLAPQAPSDVPAIELLKGINPAFKASDNLHYPDYLPNGWCAMTLGDVAEYINGRAFTPEEWEKEGLPIVRIQNLNDTSAEYNYSSRTFEDRYLIHNGDLLFAWAASLNAYIWNGKDAWLNQHIFKVIPKKCILTKYLYYTLKAKIHGFYRRSHGSGMVHITRNTLLKETILLPPFNEQERIIIAIEDLYSTLDLLTAYFTK